jgi:hypothetical protein
VRIPFTRHRCRPKLSRRQKAVNKVHARIRCRGERAGRPQWCRPSSFSTTSKTRPTKDEKRSAGPPPGVEFLAAIGHPPHRRRSARTSPDRRRDLADFSGPEALAAFAGLAPAPHDSGERNGNVHRPRHYHRGLQRIFYMSALTSVRFDLNSRTFYGRKRSEAKRHTQAVIALARRSVNVLSALIGDRRLYQVAPPRPTG